MFDNKKLSDWGYLAKMFNVPPFCQSSCVRNRQKERCREQGGAYAFVLCHAAIKTIRKSLSSKTCLKYDADAKQEETQSY